MLRKILLISVGIILSVSTFVYAGGKIVTYSYNRQEVKVKISVDNEGAYLGCSFFTNSGRQDLPARFVVGEDVVVYEIPPGTYRCEIALWRESYNSGEGPDPDNAWGLKNGYYLWGELDRKIINFSQ